MTPYFKQTQWFALSMLVIVAFGSAFISLFLGRMQIDSLMIRYLMTYGLLYVLPLFVYFKAYPVMKPVYELRIRKVSGKVILMTLVLAFCIQPALMLISTLSSLFFHNYLEGALEIYQKNPLWITILCTCLLPAFCEEAVCRGVYLSGTRMIPLGWAALLNGIFFGLLHMNVQQGLYALVFGALAVILVEYSRSILPAVLTHFTVNTTQICLSYAQAFDSGESWISPFLAFLKNPDILWIWGILSIVLALCTAGLLMMIRKETFEKQKRNG